MEGKRMKDGDHKFMSTNGALASHSIWSELIKQSDERSDQQLKALAQREYSQASFGGCRKCGHLGHLTNQCMNVLKTKGGLDINIVAKQAMDETEFEGVQRECERNEKLLDKLRKTIQKKKDKKREKKRQKKREGKKPKKEKKKQSSEEYSSESSN